MRRLLMADAWLIHCVQAAYLWFYDRTGVLLGTITFTVFAISAFCGSDHLSYVDAIGFTCALITSSLQVIRQSRGLLHVLNNSARTWIQSGIRLGCAAFFTVSPVVYAARGRWWEVASCVFILLWITMLCVQVRERKPPEKLALARQEN